MRTPSCRTEPAAETQVHYAAGSLAVERKWRSGLLAVVVAALAAACGSPAVRVPPAADHHMHLQSARTVSVLLRLKQAFKEPIEPADRQVLGGAEAVAALDAGGVRRGVVLSGAYLLGTSDIVVADEQRMVSDENAWTAKEAARYPSRLVGFCSVNPLKDYAESEVAHCAAIGLGGLKLHFTSSAVDLSNPDHVARLRRVLGAANRLRMPLLIHLRTRAADYGEREANVFLDRLLPAAADVPVVIAHMGGWGGYDKATDAALSTMAGMCAAVPGPCRRLFFDLAFTVLPKGASDAPARTPLGMLADAQRNFPDGNQRLAEHVRALGLDHVLFATDWPGMTQADTAEAIRGSLPLRPAEIDAIFANQAPFLR
jgi:predicted TIM-barrel fold metal-dependent hydrolase